MKKTKFIIITGGVLSGLGKGVVSASIGKLLSSNFKVIPLKCDGYLNIDPGTMNPMEHGEVFVLDDGGEVDMDFGHYERFLNIACKKQWNLTSGKIFQKIIDKERQGKYLGKTVQMIPHVTDEIKQNILDIAKEENADFMLIELGGTIGDIEMDLFVEAIRQFRLELGENRVLFAHLTYVPKLMVVGEQKTKPTQQSVNILQSKGIQPDVIIARSEQILDAKTKEKIALFANINKENVISNPDLKTIYELPLLFEKQGFTKILEKRFKIKINKTSNKWRKLVKNIKHPNKDVNIAICGKYT
ncbi:MAG: CTP synthase [Nanoarchaeota archaeon]|nr:CTP synthase [Nanoarchaeota archaeon]